MNAVILLVSCAGRDEAVRIARALVARNLAACVQLRPHDSIYRWQGQVAEEAEISLLVKTTAARAEAAAATIRSLHSYTVPAILMVPAVAAAPVAAWLEEATAAQTREPFA